MSPGLNSNGVEKDGNGDDNGVTERRENENNKRKRKRKSLLDGYYYKRRLEGAKKKVLSPINKLQKLFKRDTRSSSPSFPSNSNLPSNATMVGSYCSCLCLSKKPQTIDIASDDIDPNDPRISYDYVKSLLEENDFYSRECNTHFVE